jgi:hypothetical protein
MLIAELLREFLQANDTLRAALDSATGTRVARNASPDSSRGPGIRQ